MVEISSFLRLFWSFPVNLLFILGVVASTNYGRCVFLTEQQFIWIRPPRYLLADPNLEEPVVTAMHVIATHWLNAS